MAHVLAKDLRDAVLQFAVEGKLSSIHLDDSNISSLIDKLVLNPKLESSEPPFEIPEHWAWIQIGNLGKSADTKSFADGPFGSNLKKIHQIESPEVRIIQLSNVGEHSWQDDNVKYTSYEHLKTIARCEVHPGDFVIAKMMPAGRTIIMPNIGTKITLGSDVVKFVPNEALNKEYLLLAMRSNCFISQVYTETKGITRVRTSLNKIKSYYLPIPPIEEQARIVAKVNEIMSKIDEYEKLENQLVKLKEQFPQDMKESISLSAFKGELSDSHISDSPVIQLLESINLVKSEKIKKGELKKEKDLPEITDFDIPYELPKNWKWVRFGDYCEKVTDQVASGSFKAIRENVKSLKDEDFALMVKIADFGNNFNKNLTYTDKHGYEFLKNSNLFGGELILSNIGSIGKVFIVPNLHKPMTLAPNSIMLRLTDDSLRDYIYHYLNSPVGYNQLMSITSGTAMKKFNKTDFKKLLIPIPPIEEQQRIVDKLDELLPLVDKLAELN